MTRAVIILFLASGLASLGVLLLALGLVSPPTWLATAGISMGGLAAAAFALHGWCRAHEQPAQAPRVVIALLYPDQVEQLDALLEVVDVRSEDPVVLLVTVGLPSSAALAGSAAAGGGARKASHQWDERLVRRLSRTVAEAGRPVHLLDAGGTDPSTIALQVASSLQAKRIVAVLTHDTSVREQRCRARRAWRSLAPPQLALRVDLVSPEVETSVTFVLPERRRSGERGPGTELRKERGRDG